MNLHATVKIDAMIQARTGSQRLPRKMIREVAGLPLITHLIRRVKAAHLIDEICVATTDGPDDDLLARMVQKEGVSCFRGSTHDVLDRVTRAHAQACSSICVELHGDNAAIDPRLIDRLIGIYLTQKKNFDYVTNTRTSTYPAGCEVAVYPYHVLREANMHPRFDVPREHVGPHIYGQLDRFRVLNCEAPSHLRFPHIHFEIDTEQDFEFVTHIYEGLADAPSDYSLETAISLALRSDVWKLNSHVQRRYAQHRLDHK
jgi:spore coat polysaccharide biosynthesis protein SpsF